MDSELGIEPGDIVTTSYNSGPYIVTRVSGPFDWRYGWNDNGEYARLPCERHWSLSCKGAPGSHYEGKTGFALNGVRQIDGRWYSRDNEIYVAKPLNIADVLEMAQIPLPLEV